MVKNEQHRVVTGSIGLNIINGWVDFGVRDLGAAVKRKRTKSEKTPGRPKYVPNASRFVSPFQPAFQPAFRSVSRLAWGVPDVTSKPSNLRKAGLYPVGVYVNGS